MSGRFIGNQHNTLVPVPITLNMSVFSMMTRREISTSPRLWCPSFSPSLIVIKSGHNAPGKDEEITVDTELSDSVDHAKASAAIDHTYYVSYVDEAGGAYCLVLLSRVGHKAATIVSHWSLSLATVCILSHERPISSSSATTVCRHVVFGLPLALFSWCPTLGILSGGFFST